MRINRFLLAIMAAGLVACGTVSEPQPAAPADPVPAAQAEPPAAPAAAEAPVSAPVVVAEPAPVQTVAESAPPPKPRPVKAVRVAKKAPAATPAPVQPAAPTEAEIAAAMTLVEDGLARFMLERARFTAPQTLKQDATGTATLDFGTAAAFEQARAALAGNARVQQAGIQIPSRVQCRLAGENIGVKPGSPEIQELNGAQAGAWRWQLLPTREGKAKLRLSVDVETAVAGKAASRTIHTMERELVIEPSAAQSQPGFLSANWWWMVIVLVVAGAAFWFVRRRA